MTMKWVAAAVAGMLGVGVGGVWIANANAQVRSNPPSVAGPVSPTPPAVPVDAKVLQQKAGPDGVNKEKKVLSPDEIVQGKIEGAVRVEFTVESLYWETGVSTEKQIPMNFKLKGVKANGDVFQVQVADQVFTRLYELGIENSPKENITEGTPAVYRHFIGKTVRVNEVVKRLPLAQGDGFLYWLRIGSLDQIESVSKK